LSEGYPATVPFRVLLRTIGPSCPALPGNLRHSFSLPGSLSFSFFLSLLDVSSPPPAELSSLPLSKTRRCRPSHPLGDGCGRPRHRPPFPPLFSVVGVFDLSSVLSRGDSPWTRGCRRPAVFWLFDLPVDHSNFSSLYSYTFPEINECFAPLRWTFGPLQLPPRSLEKHDGRHVGVFKSCSCWPAITQFPLPFSLLVRSSTHVAGADFLNPWWRMMASLLQDRLLNLSSQFLVRWKFAPVQRSTLRCSLTLHFPLPNRPSNRKQHTVILRVPPGDRSFSSISLHLQSESRVSVQPFSFPGTRINFFMCLSAARGSPLRVRSSRGGLHTFLNLKILNTAVRSLKIL